MVRSPESLALLRDGYRRYDEYVDVVSCFEWLFDETQDLPETVKHFERFPKCLVPGKGRGKSARTVTPDFLVVFEDDSVLVGEIASIARHENSVDKLCSQLLAYEAIAEVSVGDGTKISPSRIDVMWLVSVELSNDACTRVLDDRFHNADHEFKPQKAPCIVQYARLADKYTFARIPRPDNGVFLSGLPSTNIGGYLDKNLNIRPERFVHIKTAKGFMNDPAEPLYLATYLYVRVWPLMFGRGTAEERITSQAVSAELQRTYSYGRHKEVVAALELLADAGLAAKQSNGTWTVKRKVLGSKGDREVHTKILELVEITQQRPAPSRRATRNLMHAQLSLFDDIDSSPS
ncbi:hypothetical protein [Paenarthrobacter sp. AMU7]|uniref:Uncharacterized protein n=1 Tax=Paenarthrobacter sp. AMU7 TaxID=3162492 RepID=A0AB39YI58_9MICC